MKERKKVKRAWSLARWMEEGFFLKCLESGGLIPILPQIQVKQPAIGHNATKKQIKWRCPLQEDVREHA